MRHGTYLRTICEILDGGFGLVARHIANPSDRLAMRVESGVHHAMLDGA
jgi:hypothetical protein